jgi:hypothetical protein
MDVAVGGALPLPWSSRSLSFLKLEKRTMIFMVYVMRLKGIEDVNNGPWLAASH